jgi:hypothetical protein
MRKSPLVLQFVIAPLQQFSHRMGGKELWRNSFLRCLPSHRFGTVLAELEGGCVIFVRPCASGTVETVGLVGAKKKKRGLRQMHLLGHGLRGGLQCTPTTGWRVVLLDSRNVALFHSLGSPSFVSSATSPTVVSSYYRPRTSSSP